MKEQTPNPVRRPIPNLHVSDSHYANLRFVLQSWRRIGRAADDPTFIFDASENSMGPSPDCPVPAAPLPAGSPAAIPARAGSASPAEFLAASRIDTIGAAAGLREARSRMAIALFGTGAGEFGTTRAYPLDTSACGGCRALSPMAQQLPRFGGFRAVAAFSITTRAALPPTARLHFFANLCLNRSPKAREDDNEGDRDRRPVRARPSQAG